MEMDEESVKEVAKQLRKPEGEQGYKVATLMNESNALMNRVAIDELNLQSKDHLLEIGMGNGLFIKEIFAKQSNIKYTGLDYSEHMIEEAKKLNKSYVAAKQANFLLGTADQLPFLDNEFDKVLTVNTIYFWKNPTAVLLEISRVLNKSGEFVISIRPKECMQHYPFTKYDFKMYTENELIHLLEENHFTISKKIRKREENVEMNGKSFPMEFLVIKGIFTL